MDIASDLALIAAQLDAYHDDHYSTSELAVFRRGDEVNYTVKLATFPNDYFEFNNATSVVAFFELVNEDTDPMAAANKLIQLEQRIADKIRTEAEIAVLELQVGQLPESERIMRERDAASTKLNVAQAQILVIDEERATIEDAARAKEAELAASEAALAAEAVVP